MVKKSMLMLAGLLLTVSALMAGGQQGGGETDEIKVNPAGVYPIVDERLTMTGLGTTRPVMDNMNAEFNTFGKYYTDLTNIDVKWTMVPENEAQTKANLLMASGEYPDIMTNIWFTPSQLIVYGEQGMLAPLEDYIDEYAPNMAKLFADFPHIEKQATLNGHIYGITQPQVCYHCWVHFKMWINTDWLDKLGLDMPETTEEFRDVLMAFKTQDPNGNGKADEIPYMAVSKGGWDAFTTPFLMNSFIYNRQRGNTLCEPNIIDGKVDVPYTKDEWREGLKYMAELAKDGLLSADSFVIDNKQLQQIGENPEAPLLGAFPGGVHTGVQINGESGRWLNYETVPPLRGPEGVRWAAYDAPQANAKAVITSKVASVAAALRYFDGIFEEENQRNMELGMEGVGWRWVDESEGKLGINGKPARWEQLVPINEQPINSSWQQAMPKIETVDMRQSRVAGGPTDYEVILKKNSDEYQKYLPPATMLLPPLPVSADDAAESAEIESSLNDYLKEATARFVIGDLDINDDAVWANYLQELENIGLSRYLEISNIAYDKVK